MIEQPEDLADADETPFDEELFSERLKEAHLLGIHYTGRDLAELEIQLAMVKTERGSDHPVPCFGLAHEPTDRRCRMCSLRGPCSERDTRPRVEVLDPQHLESVVCESCGRGELSVELLTRDTRELRDYGCTWPGCPNTLGLQCGWAPRRAIHSIVIEDSKAAKAKETAVEVEEQPASPEPAKKKRRPREKKGARAEKSDPVPKKGKAPKVPKAEAPEEIVEKAVARAAEKVEKEIAKRPKLEIVPDPEHTATLGFVCGGMRYRSLTAVVIGETGSKDWSGPRFFRVKSNLTAGMRLEREWQGRMIVVDVVFD